MNSSKDTTAVAEALERARGAVVQENWPDVRLHATRALELAQRDGDQAAEGRALRLRAVAGREIDGGSEAVESDFRRAIVLLRGAGDRRFRAYTESDLVGLLVARGDTIEAGGLIDSAEEALLSLGLVEDAQRCQHARVWMDLVAGEYARALERARAAVPMDRAMMSLKGEGWALKGGALAATFAADLDAALEFAEEFFSLARLGGRTVELLEAHQIYYRVLARRGDPRGVDGLSAIQPGVDGLGQPIASARARVIMADARLGDRPDIAAYLAREECEAARSLVGPWLVAELRHLDRRWSEMPIRREGNRLVIDLGRRGCLQTEHAILDHARVASARTRERKKTRQAEDLCLSRRNFYKLLDNLKSQASGGGKKQRRRRLPS
jgi:hypothetical protein